MDTWALWIIAVSVILYFYSRKARPALKSFSYWLLGIGMGLLFGAFWAVALITGVFR